MPYTTDEGGRLNNFANEPAMYEAEPPNSTQRRNYAIVSAGAIALICGLVYLAFTVS